MKKPPRYWRKLELAPRDIFGPEPEPVIAATMAEYSESREQAIARLEADFAKTKVYINDRYQVQVRVTDNPDFVQINVRRRDGAPIHDWRDLQQIKNEIVGEECEAVELYPAESRLVDTSNKYHLWACIHPGKFSLGMDFGAPDVRDDDGERHPGLRQRPL